MPARIRGEADGLLVEAGTPDEPARFRPFARSLLLCPSCGSAHVAQVLGDNGGISYVCTACGHSWS
ncbi:hypothetical protein ACWCP6_02255 [Streptomyces sp. NPDC002004]